MDFFDIFYGVKFGDMGFQVFGCVQFQIFFFEGEDFGGGGYVCILNFEFDDEE